MNRWFGGCLDLSKILNKRGNIVIDSKGKKYIFRYAKFYNFRKVVSGKSLLVCYQSDSWEFWIMDPQWILNTKNLRSERITSYKYILDALSMFHSDGKLMKKLVKNKRIVEINK